MRLASRFGRYNSIRRERPLTDDELMQFVPSVFSGDKHESRSERYTYIPTINIINKLRDEGFQPFFACQSRVRDLGRREYSKHMLRLRREGHINGKEVPEITRNEGKQGTSLPYIPSGSFAKAMLIEGADANASVTGNESTVPMQLRITGLVEMPNSKTYDATGCFVGLEAWGDVSSERAIVRTRNISCLKDGKTIDMPIKGHVSFRGKNGIKGEVVMRNGKILGWAWGAGFVDGIGQGMERASQPAVGLGATAAYGAGDVLKMGIGGGASKAAQTLSDYYIKRAEQYHPVIPIGAGNEVTVVFQDGFQLKTVEEMALEQSQSTAEEGNPESPVPNPPSAESHLNGFNTDQMLKQLGNLNPQQFMSGDKNPLGGDAGKEGGNGG
ncbi:TPA: F-type conjugal transfer pilus assembly protein TraB [Escherichia coli]|nr:F-type conjugal transfer pilus assembly protein TraB [Escherichia coli]